MRFKVLCAFLLLNCSVVMLGQAAGPTAWDVFGGGSYNRITNTNSGESLYGWAASVSERPYNTRRWIGGTIEVSGAYRDTTTTVSGTTLTTSYNLYTIMGGPLLAIPTGRVRPFAHVLFGGGFQNATASAGTVSASASSKNVAFAGGGGVDISLNRTWAIRGQADWLRVAETNASALDLVHASAGIVARF